MYNITNKGRGQIRKKVRKFSSPLSPKLSIKWQKRVTTEPKGGAPIPVEYECI